MTITPTLGGGRVGPPEARPGHGSLSIVTTAPTPVVLNTWTPILATTWALGQTPNLFDNPVAGRLRYIGEPLLHSPGNGGLSLISDTNNVIVTATFAVNGVVGVASEFERKISVAGDTGAMPLAGDAILGENDYVEVWIKADKTGNVTATKLYFNVFGAFEVLL